MIATLAEVLEPNGPLGLITAPMSLRDVLMALPDGLPLYRCAWVALKVDVMVTRSIRKGRQLLIIAGDTLAYEERL